MHVYMNICINTCAHIHIFRQENIHLTYIIFRTNTRLAFVYLTVRHLSVIYVVLARHCIAMQHTATHYRHIATHEVPRDSMRKNGSRCLIFFMSLHARTFTQVIIICTHMQSRCIKQHVYMYIGTNSMEKYIYIHIHIHTFACMHVYIHTHTHKHTHTQMHTYTDICTPLIQGCHVYTHTHT